MTHTSSTLKADTSPPLAVIGVRARNTAGVIRQIEAGFPFRALERLGRVLDLGATDAAALIDLPTATYHRRKRAGQLASDESDRLARIARIVTRAIALFEGDVERAREWLKRPKPALANATPLDFSRTDFGAREVEALIDRLEHGVYS